MFNSRRLLTSCLLTVAMLLSFATSAFAFDGRGGDRVSIPAGEVVNDDLYVGANDFVLDGTIDGDLIAGGQMITINGIVNGNVIAGGQTIVINGTVTGDVVAGGSVLFFGESANIGGDVVGAGYSVEFRKGGAIGRDAVLAAAQILFAADVARDVQAGAGALEIAGRVGRNVHAAVGEANRAQAGPPPTVFMPQSTVPVPVIRQGLTIDPAARILGNLEYTQNSDLAFPAGVVQGAITRQLQPEDENKATVPATMAEKTGKWALNALRSLVTLILLALGLLWLFPGFVRALSEQLRSKTWPSLGWGLVAYAGFFFLLLLTLFLMIVGAVVFGVLTLNGLSAAIVLLGILLLFTLILGFVLAATYLAKIVFGTMLGKWILGRASSPLADNRYWPTIIGLSIIVIVIAVLTFPAIPGFLGALVNFAIVLFGLGALWLWMRQALQKRAPVVT
ncbi:MAG TPA: polymer-forming cytoskeletal protein [Anaerolineales bacterium]